MKIGVVTAGYVAAFLLASGVVAIRVASTSGPAAQAESGMYAAGDAMLFVAVFGVAALVPTGAALFFLRSYRRFWTVLSAVGLGIGITGLAAVVLFALGRHVAAAVASRDMGRALRAQDPGRAPARAHVSRVHRVRAVPRPAPGVPRRRDDGGGGERVWRVHLVRPAPFSPGIVARSSPARLAVTMSTPASVATPPAISVAVGRPPNSAIDQSQVTTGVEGEDDREHAHVHAAAARGSRARG